MSDSIQVYEVPETESNVRVDVFLASQMPDMSRSHIQKLVSAGLVTVNGKNVKANYKAQQKDIVSVSIPAPEPLDVKPESIPLDILYEDQDIIVVNKPRGMVVHPAAGNYHGTLVNALLNHCGDLSGINGVVRPGIVHRLDKDTSGVMVVAKTDRAHAHLAQQIKDRVAGRKYLALVHGNVKADEGIIDAPIGRHPSDRKKMAVVFQHSRAAITRFRVLERFSNYTLMECKLATGRTHQIRVHMAHIGHPVVGDPKYGPKNCSFNIGGQALHSAELTFRHPISGQQLVFLAPVPADMQEILRNIANNSR